MSVRFETIDAGAGQVGIATLDAEKSLNALTLPMIESLQNQITAWAADDEIYGVIICGAGKAFCAGGDIRALYESMINANNYSQDFFEKEYRLDACLHDFAKPVVVWAHGITMGGGMGIMQGASFRIATEATKMAMPEITIGLFPDVGASYFLRKVPNDWGLFLALTGARFKGGEAVTLNLADFWVEDSLFDRLQSDLAQGEISNATELETFLQDFFNAHCKKEEVGEIGQHKAFVETVLKCQDVVSLIHWARAYSPVDDWEKLLVQNILNACPTSLGLIYALWERGAKWSVHTAFFKEWLVACNCAIRGDFREGVRALLIDKDNQPRWNPPTAAGVTPALIEQHFVSPRADKQNPLVNLMGDQS